MPLQAFFLTPGSEADGQNAAGRSSADQRFCLFHPAASPRPIASVVYVHPFAEEMNKSRRMAALQAKSLAARGCSVLQIDLAGCGDSSGDFEEATWQGWLADVALACRWIQRDSMQHGAAAPLWLWGTRAGCLVAAEAARQFDLACNFLFWQPPGAGKSQLQQFLRLKLAADMAAGKGVMEDMRRRIAAGEPVEVAGYSLGAELALGFEASKLAPPRQAGRVEWLEVSSRPDAGLLPASEAPMRQWREAGWQVRSHVASGPAFWQTSEIEEAPALIEATTLAIDVPAQVAAFEQSSSSAMT